MSISQCRFWFTSTNRRRVRFTSKKGKRWRERANLRVVLNLLIFGVRSLFFPWKLVGMDFSRCSRKVRSIQSDQDILLVCLFCSLFVDVTMVIEQLRGNHFRSMEDPHCYSIDSEILEVLRISQRFLVQALFARRC